MGNPFQMAERGYESYGNTKRLCLHSIIHPYESKFHNFLVSLTGIGWSGLDWPGMVWPGLAWTCLAWHGLDWPGLAWTGLAWTGLDWPGLAWPGLSLVVPNRLSSTRKRRFAQPLCDSLCLKF